MPNIILRIEKASDEISKRDDVCCYVLSDTLPKQMFNVALNTGKMVLVEGPGALDKCKEYGLDGVVKEIDVTKPLKSQIKAMREALKKKTLGVIIPARRHEAMLAGEVEPDFIAFYSDDEQKDTEVVNWYNELFLIPLAWVCKDHKQDEIKNNVDFMMISAENF